MYFAKLIFGQFYHIFDYKFEIEVEQEVSKEAYEALKANEQFEVREVKKGKINPKTEVK